ncbi:MAG: DAK2 domain-containing protein [Dehalococcoidia bacterium]|nr:DAK2 domain-containing protein [Dehalococcoidia bacterium]
MTRPLDRLTGRDLNSALAAALAALERNRDVINAMNVFPVPDGDTGTNMYLTVKATWDEVAHLDQDPAGRVLAAMAHGALFNARGNSGVILSQFFGGLARSVGEEQEVVTSQSLAHALQSASDAAYRAVSRPVEGTMLTVMRLAAEGARRAEARPGADVLTVLEAACREAQQALEQTPELLPVLKQAGVVDAGGQGVVVILEAMRRFLAGEEPLGALEGVQGPLLSGRVREEFLSATEEDIYGYCTQFLIQGEGLEVDAIREEMARLASSAVVVGDERTVRVHVHARDPGQVFSYAVAQGTLSQVSLQSMDEQHQEFLVSPHQEQRNVAVVAVAWGKGFGQVFRQLGAGVVECGQTMNPSIQELVHSARRQQAKEVILLPNNPNVVLAAQQAALLEREPRLRVVEARTLPQGVAALLAFNPERGAEENVEAMGQAARSLQTGEVTRAVRDTEMDGVSCKAGQCIALLEGRLVASGEEETKVLYELLALANPQEGSLITLFYGQGVSDPQAQETAQSVRGQCPGTEVEVAYGGQPLYTYLISIE